VRARPVEIYLLAPESRIKPVSAARRGRKRVICSLATGTHRRLMAVASPTLVAYAERWSWDVVLSSENLAGDRPPAWAKVRLLRELIETYEHVFWIDADALFVGLDRDVLSELPEGRDLFVVEHPQAEPGAPIVPNAGVMLLKQSAFTRDFLDRIWGMTEYIEHNWWENAALLHLLGHSLEPPWSVVEETPDRAHVGFIDLAWNSVPGLCEADHPMVMHHARADNRSFETRLAGMTADLDRFTTSLRPG
jgi:hypothetical protein